MKLLLKLKDKDEAQSLKYRLELTGIPIFIGSENTGPAMGFIYADGYTIWAEIDGQYECAVLAINDESYEPKQPVNINDFRVAQNGQMASFRDGFSKVNEYILNTLVICRITGFIIYMFLWDNM